MVFVNCMIKNIPQLFLSEMFLLAKIYFEVYLKEARGY